MQATTTRPKITATTDGEGVVSHAGSRLLADVADRTTLSTELAEALAGLRRSRTRHDPGRVLVDMAVAPADAGEKLPQPQRAAGVGRERRGVLTRPGAHPNRTGATAPPNPAEEFTHHRFPHPRNPAVVNGPEDEVLDWWYATRSISFGLFKQSGRARHLRRPASTVPVAHPRTMRSQR